MRKMLCGKTAIVLGIFSVLAFTGTIVFAEEIIPTTSSAVATVFGQSIMNDELNPDTQTQNNMKQRLEGEKFNEWLTQYRANQLFGKILRVLMDTYTKEHNIAVTDEEIETRSAHFNRMMEERKKENEKTRQDLLKELQAPTITEKREKAASEHLAALNSVRESDKKWDKSLQDLQEKDGGKAWKEATRKIGEVEMKRWKTNKALYEQYGGKVIFQQFGLEPIDAYGKLLKDNEAKKSFQILDSGLKKNFYHYIEMQHSEMPEKMAKFYFEKPWWQRTNEELVTAGFKD